MSPHLVNKKNQNCSLLGLYFAVAGRPEHLLALGKHVQVHLREERNVEEHDKPEEVQVGESEIKFVGHLDGPHFLCACVTLSPVEAQQLARHTDRVQNDKGCVPQHDQDAGHGSDQVEGVVTVPDDLSDAPG